MTPEERKLLQEVNTRLKKLEQYTTSIGGSFEFKKIVQMYAAENPTFQGLVASGVFTHNGDNVGFYGASPVVQADHIGDPSGGSVEDSEARDAIDDILVVLEDLGFTKTS